MSDYDSDTHHSKKGNLLEQIGQLLPKEDTDVQLKISDKKTEAEFKPIEAHFVKKQADINYDTKRSLASTQNGHSKTTVNNSHENEELKRQQLREENDISVFHQMQTAQEYLEKIRINLQLDDLYTVIDSCHYNHLDNFIPILVKLGFNYETPRDDATEIFVPLSYLNDLDQEIEAKKQQFQLQIWKNGGTKVFERLLVQSLASSKPLQNWNVFGDIIVFQTQEENSIYLVQCFQDKNCQLIRFVFPVHFSEDFEDIKPTRNIGYFQGKIFVINNNNLSYFNIPEDIPSSNSVQTDVFIKKEEFFEVALDENLKLIRLEAFDLQGMTIVVENNTENCVQFLKLEQIKKNFGGIEKINLCLLGIQKKKDLVEGKRQKMKQLITVIAKNQTNGQSFHVGICLLNDGSIDFYYDFSLLRQKDNIQAESDFRLDTLNFKYLSTDLKNFYFSDGQDLFYTKISWGSRLSYNTCQKNERPFNQDLLILHTDVRIKNYFKIYSAFLNYKTYLLLSHRSMITVFDLTNEKPSQCIGSYHFKEVVLELTSIISENNETETVQVTTTDGKIQIISINDDVAEIEKTIDPFAGEQVINVFPNKYNNGMVFYLTRQNTKRLKPSIKIEGANQIYDNTSVTNNRGTYALSVLDSEGTKYELFTSQNNQCLTETSSVCIYPSYESDPDDLTQFMIDDEQNSQSFVYGLRIKQKEEKVIQHQFFSPLHSPTNINTKNLSAVVEAGQKYYITNDENYTFDFVNHEYDQGKLVASVMAKEDQYGKLKGSIARITTLGIAIYSKDHKFKSFYSNLRVSKIIQIDSFFMYCLCDSSYNDIQFQKLDRDPIKAQGIYQKNSRHCGLYVIDLLRLIKDNLIEMYQLSNALISINNQVAYSSLIDKVALLQNFHSIQINPFSHRNTINFVGMHSKQGYLIWREKNGFFSAMDKQGQLHTWSMASGRHLYEQNFVHQEKNGDSTNLLKKMVEGFEIYRTNDEDNIYLMNYLQRNNSTIQLLVRQSDSKVKTKLAKQLGQFLLTKVLVELSLKPIDIEYEFKVIQLKMHQDFQNDSSTKLVGREEVIELLKFTFVPYRYLAIFNRLPQLILSKDTQNLMEIVGHAIFNIYTRGEKSADGTVLWTLDPQRKLIKFPELLLGKMHLPFMFSPNFKYFFNVDYEKGCFNICSPTEGWVRDIPSDLISLTTLIQSKNKAVDAIMQQASRMSWISDNLMTFVNPEGLWVVLNVEKDLRVECYNKIPNFDVLDYSSPHATLQTSTIDENDVFNRLLRNQQKESISVSYFKYKAKLDREQRLIRAQDEIYNQRKLMSQLYQIDYEDPWSKFQSQWQTETPFTILNWFCVDQLMMDLNFKIDNMSQDNKIQILINHFPNRQTVMHKLALNAVQGSENKVLDNNSTLYKFLQAAALGKTQTTHQIEMKIKKREFQVSFIEDTYGRTPLDIALGFYRKSNQGLLLFQKRPISDSEQKDDYNSLSIAGIFFGCVKDYGFLHFSPIIKEIVIKAIQLGVPEMGEFIESRFKKSVQNPMVYQKPLNRKILDKNMQMVGEEEHVVHKNYAVKQLPLFMPKSEIVNEIFQKEGQSRAMEMFYLDIPDLHLHSYYGVQFIQALNKTKEIQMFTNPSVQMIINYHWNSSKVRNYMLFAQMLPYLIQLATFIYWSNFLLISEITHDLESEVVSSILASTSIWQLLIEFRQMSVYGFDYFKCKWRYLETIPIILILINVFRGKSAGSFYIDETFFRIQSVAALMMWAKFIYFLRQFEKTGFLIRALLEVFVAMQSYFLLLVIMIVGFADSFYSVAKAQNTMEIGYINGFNDGTNYGDALYNSYNILMGVWDTFGDDPQANILFLMMTVIVVILMLNMLICFMEKTFEKVYYSQIEWGYKEKVELICDIYSVLTIKNERFMLATAASELLFYAREDSANNQAIPDVEGGDEMTTAEQLDSISDDLKAIKLQLGQDELKFVELQEKLVSGVEEALKEQMKEMKQRK